MPTRKIATATMAKMMGSLLPWSEYSSYSSLRSGLPCRFRVRGSDSSGTYLALWAGWDRTVCGVLARSGKRTFICLSVPGVLGCALFLYIHSDLGRMALTDAHIWLPALAEDLVAFSIVSCAVLAFRTRRGRTDGGRR